MLSKAEIVKLLETNDKAVARALVVVNNNQTSTEQKSESTINRNGEGFRPCHARMGTSMATFFAKRGYLTDKQIAYWRKTDKTGAMRITIYWRQLAEAAELKQAGVTKSVIAPPTTVTVTVAPPAAVSDDIGNLCEERLALHQALANEKDENAAERMYDRLIQIDEQ